jgi:hypothetical protein
MIIAIKTISIVGAVALLMASAAIRPASAQCRGGASGILVNDLGAEMVVSYAFDGTQHKSMKVSTQMYALGGTDTLAWHYMCFCGKFEGDTKICSKRRSKSSDSGDDSISNEGGCSFKEGGTSICNDIPARGCSGG